MMKIAEEFTRETGIDVEIISRRTVFDAPADLVNNAELDGRPDIILMQAPDIGNLVASNYLMPLDINDDTTERFEDVAFDSFSYGGKTYGVGYSVDTSGLIYNKDIISESDLPSNWEEFFIKAKALTVTDPDGNVLQYGTKLNPKDIWFNYPIIYEYGGYYYGKYPDGSYNPYDLGIDNESMMSYIRKMKEAMTDKLTITNPNHTESHISYDFACGKVAMILYGLWNAQIYQNKGVNYGIAMLPKHKDGSISKPFSTVQGFVINNYSLQKDNALSFLNYILKDENQQFLIEAGNRGSKKTGDRNSTNKSVISSDYVQSDSVLRALSEIGKHSEPFPNIPEGPFWYNYTPITFRTIFFEESVSEETAIEADLRDLGDRIRNDIALMNNSPEHIEISSGTVIFYALIVFLFFFVTSFFNFKRKNKTLYGKFNKKETLCAWITLCPLIVLLVVFYIYPIFYNIYLSFTDYSGINMRNFGIIGFSNYEQIFSSQINGLVGLVVWTFCFAAIVIVFSFLLGTFFATILERINIRISKLYRTIFILPWVVPAVITLLMWQGLLETEGGMINKLLGFFGIPALPWLSNPILAKVSVILVMIWFSFPYFMVVVLGLLKTIPKNFYDVAKIEGASKFHVFTKITLPCVFRTMQPMLIMGFIMQFNQFGVYLLTQGGPVSNSLGAPGATDLLITYVFNTAFNTRRYSLAASYSVIIFIFIGLFAIIAMYLSEKRREGENS